MHVLRLCPHGAAKSVIAAAMLRDMAKSRTLDLSVSTAGTDPDPRVNPIAIETLDRRGLRWVGTPRLVQRQDIERADIVVSFGCEMGRLPAKPARIVDWSDMPNVSDDADGFIVAVESRLDQLLV